MPGWGTAVQWQSIQQLPSPVRRRPKRAYACSGLQFRAIKAAPERVEYRLKLSQRYAYVGVA